MFTALTELVKVSAAAQTFHLYFLIKSYQRSDFGKKFLVGSDVTKKKNKKKKLWLVSFSVTDSCSSLPSSCSSYSLPPPSGFSSPAGELMPSFSFTLSSSVTGLSHLSSLCLFLNPLSLSLSIHPSLLPALFSSIPTLFSFFTPPLPSSATI